MKTEIHLQANPGNSWQDSTLSIYGRDAEGYADPVVSRTVSALELPALALFGAVAVALITLAQEGGYVLTSAIIEPAAAIPIYDPETSGLIGSRRAFTFFCTQANEADARRQRSNAIHTEELSPEARDATAALWEMLTALG